MGSITTNYVNVNGVDLCWFERGAEFRSAGTVLLVHATGFHARCWDQVASHLEGRHVIALDQRGHGRSGKVPPYTWGVFGEDLTGFVKALDLTGVIGVGHSMGGHALVIAAANEPTRFSSLVLVDPVILAPAAYAQFAGGANPDEHPVARRRNVYASPDEMITSLGSRGSFSAWEPAVLRDYCVHGLLPEGSGFVLACPPKVEATIYTGSAGTNILDRARAIKMPVTLLRAAPRTADHSPMDFSKSPTWPELITCFSNGVEVYLPGLTHFIPMQAPKLVAEHILKYPQNL